MVDKRPPAGGWPALALAAILAAAPVAGLAEDKPPQSGDAEGEPLRIKITAPAAEATWRETPASVTVVESEQLAGEPDLSLDQALERVPGVFAQNRLNFAQGLRLSIRGFGARASFGVRGVRVLVDGVPLTLPDGQTETDALDLGLVDQVEVIRGPASTIHGNAAGGVVLVNTREPPDENAARFNLAAGELGYRRVRAEAGGPLGDWRGLAAVNATRLDGFRPLNDTETDIVTGKLARSFDAGELRLRVNAIDTEAQDPGALTAEQLAADRTQAAPGNLQFDAGETVSQQRVAAVWTGAPAARRDYRVLAYFGERDFANRLPFTGGGQVAFDRRFGGIEGAYSLRSRWLGLAHETTVGMSIEAQRDERRRFDNNDGVRGELTLDQDERAESYGVFVQDSVTLTSRLSASLGLRFDRIELSVDDRFRTDGDDSGDRELEDVSFSSGLGYHLTRADQVYARVATSFETPTINELANPAGGGFNPDLDPAEAINYELGVKGERSGLRYEAAAFSITVDDQLVPFELPGQPERTFFRNAGESRRNGVELAATWQFAPHWHTAASYTYADYEFERFVAAGGDFAGNDIPGIPRQQFFGELGYQRAGWFGRANVNVYDRLFADDANDTRVSGYGVLDARFGFSGVDGGWLIEPYAGVDNILDKDYNDNIRVNAFGGRYFEPAAGRTVYAGIKLSSR